MTLEVNNEMVQSGRNYVLPIYKTGESMITIRANSNIPSEKEFMNKVLDLFTEYAKGPTIED